MRLTSVITALFSFIVSFNAFATATWVCNLGPGETPGLGSVEMVFTTGRVVGSPIVSEKIQFFRVSRDRPAAQTLLGTIDVELVVGYWNTEKSLRIRAVDTLPGASAEDDVLFFEAVADRLTPAEVERGITSAYKLESQAFLRLMDPRNPHTVTRNQRKQGTRVTCTSG